MMRALAGAVLIAAMVLGVAHGDDAYPTRPVSMVVAFPPGGGTRATIRAPRIQGRISGLGRSWARRTRYGFASAILPGPMPQTKC